MLYIEELQTDGWSICIGDVFNNPSMPYRLKVTKVEIEDGECNPNNAKVHCVAVSLKNKNKVINISDDNCNRAWYFNEFWTK